MILVQNPQIYEAMVSSIVEIIYHFDLHLAFSSTPSPSPFDRFEGFGIL